MSSIMNLISTKIKVEIGNIICLNLLKPIDVIFLKTFAFLEH